MNRSARSRSLIKAVTLLSNCVRCMIIGLITSMPSRSGYLLFSFLLRILNFSFRRETVSKPSKIGMFMSRSNKDTGHYVTQRSFSSMVYSACISNLSK